MRQNDPLIIAGKQFRSRLIAGTGKYRSMEEMRDAIDASSAEIVTVAIRRLPLDRPDEPNLMDYLDWQRYTILPNTAGCRAVDEALFTARLARELTGSSWLKLEVIPDPAYLLPDPVETLAAARVLIDEGFTVLPYLHADPVLARRLEEAGCATVIPLPSPTRPPPGAGDWRRCRAREPRHRPGEGPRRHGGGVPQGRRGRAAGLPGRTHPPQRAGAGFQPRRGRSAAGGAVGEGALRPLPYGSHRPRAVWRRGGTRGRGRGRRQRRRERRATAREGPAARGADGAGPPPARCDAGPGVAGRKRPAGGRGGRRGGRRPLAGGRADAPEAARR